MVVSRWGSETFRQSCTAAGREALAMLRQATLLHRDVWSSPAKLPRPEQTTDLVVLLHGLFATAGVLRPLRERIEAEANAVTLSFTYAPGTSVEVLAQRIGNLLSGVQGSPRIHLLGHSLGGLAVCWYVQEMPHDSRVVQTICLATPFAGSRHARLMPGVSGRDLLPGSECLRRLRTGALDSRMKLPHLSLVGANDLMVEPGAWLDCGDRRVFPGLGHNGLLYDPEVISEVVGRIRSVIDQNQDPDENGVQELGHLKSREDMEQRLSLGDARVSSGS